MKTTEYETDKNKEADTVQMYCVMLPFLLERRDFMANRTKDEVIYVRVDRRLKIRFEKQKEESGYKGNADFVGYLLDVNEGKRVDGVTLKEVRELLAEAVHELKKQGVNINQIAHVVNMYAEMFSDSNFKATNYFLKKIEDKLLQISEKLI